MRVVITGGGIAGLTAALAFARHGHEVRLLERADRFEDIGAGLQISPNAMKAFEALGLERQLLEIGDHPQSLDMRSGLSGATIFSIPMGAAGTVRYRSPYLHVHRPDLVSVLEESVRRHPEIKIEFGVGVEGYQASCDRPAVLIGSGRKVEGDLLVGADGVRSAFRRQMIGPDAPRFTGCRAWRFTVPVSAVDPLFAKSAATVWVGPHRHLVTYRIARGQLLNVVAVTEGGAAAAETWVAEGERSELSREFETWVEPIRTLVSESPRCHVWGLFDRAPLNAWSEGRAVLIGDAAHPMPPFQAQGAAMGIEDAFALAACIGPHSEDVVAALKHFVVLRRDRTARMLKSSRFNQKLFHLSEGPAQLGIHALLRAAHTLVPGFVRSRQDWIYKYDVTRACRYG